DEWIAVEVVDSGIGIPETKFEDIFKMFEQVGGSATRLQGGAGLGLAISKKLVASHGGTIRVQSLLVAGSTFTVTMPRARQALPPRLKSAEKASHPLVARHAAAVVAASFNQQDLPLGHILVVDDEP